MPEPKLILATISYAIVGFIIGRVWWRAYTRRDEEALANMYLAVMLFWPLFMVILPLAIFLYNLSVFIIQPPFRWLGRKLDNAVDRVVPEKPKRTSIHTSIWKD